MCTTPGRWWLSVPPGATTNNLTCLNCNALWWKHWEWVVFLTTSTQDPSSMAGTLIISCAVYSAAIICRTLMHDNLVSWCKPPEIGFGSEIISKAICTSWTWFTAKVFWICAFSMQIDCCIARWVVNLKFPIRQNIKCCWTWCACDCDLLCLCVDEFCFHSGFVPSCTMKSDTNLIDFSSLWQHLQLYQCGWWEWSFFESPHKNWRINTDFRERQNKYPFGWIKMMISDFKGRILYCRDYATVCKVKGPTTITGLIVDEVAGLNVDIKCNAGFVCSQALNADGSSLRNCGSFSLNMVFLECWTLYLDKTTNFRWALF